MRSLGLIPIVLAILLVPICGCGDARRDDSVRDRISIRWRLIGNLFENGTFESSLSILNNTDQPLNRDWTLYFNFSRLIVPNSFPAAVRVIHINGDFYKIQPGPEYQFLQPGEILQFDFMTQGSAISKADAPSGFYLLANDGEEPASPVQIKSVSLEGFDRLDQVRRSSSDQVPVETPFVRFHRNSTLYSLDAEDLTPVIPTPNLVEKRGGSFLLQTDSPIHFADGLDREAVFLSDQLESLTGTRLTLLQSEESPAGSVVLSIGDVSVSDRTLRSGDEAYVLEIDKQVRIQGTDAAGVFYGIQSLRSLLPLEFYANPSFPVELPRISIQDSPRFAYRGLHLDVARNFQSAQSVKKLLELMAYYKLNKFHFHLTDDEGWRLAIPDLPELTEVGGRRGHTETELDHLVPSWGSGPDPRPGFSNGSGFYTRREFIELLRYAHTRHIEVIPEIDMPGHARAAIQAMNSRFHAFSQEGQEDVGREFLLADPHDESSYRSIQNWDDNVINVCQDSTYRFLEKVVSELATMYEEANVPFRAVHTGGDEVPEGVWERSPACQRLLDSQEVEDHKGLPEYFLRRFSDILSRFDLATAGWEEIALHPGEERSKTPNPAFLGRGFRAYVWNSVAGWGGEENAYRLANSGYDVVLCNASNLYFDLAYNKDPDEPGQYWAGFVDTRKAFEFIPFNLYRSAKMDLMGERIDRGQNGGVPLTEEGKHRVLGIQGQLWGESARGQELLEYQVCPKILGLAERAWSKQPDWAVVDNDQEHERLMAEDWNRFANVLGQRELPRLDYLFGGFGYRIPLPGAIIEDGVLKANIAFPGLPIRYSIDGSDPGPDSPLYLAPTLVSGAAKLRVFTRTSRASRTTEVTP